MAAPDSTRPALDQYREFAGIYDQFAHRNDFELWLGEVLLPHLLELGLAAPGAALDVACGTGRAIPSLLRRGWEVQGCDLSPAMLAVARERFGDGVRLDVADMRRLPVLGSFDLVLVLNDAVNHLLTDGDLERAMASLALNLAPGGLLLFDCTTESFFRSAFDPSARRHVECEGRHWTWHGLGRSDRHPDVFRVEISGDSVDPIVLTQRHFSPAEFEAAIAAAGLECRRVLGQREIGERLFLNREPDDWRDDKAIYIASLPSRST